MNPSCCLIVIGRLTRLHTPLTLCVMCDQALGIMEVRTVLATLLGRFWFELAPSMGKAAQVRKNQTIALTLKMSEGLRLVATPHDPEPANKGRSRTAAPAGPLN